eukprot:m.77392 g.77392  ORF g.77392 m.77392 type:complete len:206 (+) comp36026_c0_seq1:636-1253(+)
MSNPDTISTLTALIKGRAAVHVSRVRELDHIGREVGMMVFERHRRRQVEPTGNGSSMHGKPRMGVSFNRMKDTRKVFRDDLRRLRQESQKKEGERLQSSLEDVDPSQFWGILRSDTRDDIANLEYFDEKMQILGRITNLCFVVYQVSKVLMSEFKFEDGENKASHVLDIAALLIIIQRHLPGIHAGLPCFELLLLYCACVLGLVD